MDPRNDFLNIPSAGQGYELPMAEFEHANHPGGAAAARARIAAIIDPVSPSVEGAVVAHPSILVTDRAELARATPTRAIPRRKIPSAIQPLLTAIGVFALILLMFKAPVIWSQIQYAVNKPAVTPATLPVAGSAVPLDPTITIPKINVHAPVSYEPSVVESNVQKALENGVVHYGNTAYPGQNGNFVIFGHSSNDWWEPGNYKFVFVLLDKLAPGDKFTIDYQSKRYTYQVTGTKIVVPTDVSVLNQTSTPTATLITCTPPGTSLKRLIVSAVQINPSPTNVAVKASVSPTATSSASLSGGSTGFFQQIGHVIGGIGQGISSLFGGASATPPTNQTPSSDQIPVAK